MRLPIVRGIFFTRWHKLSSRHASRFIVSISHKTLIVGIVCTEFVGSLFAVEGGVGRTLPGVWIQPQGAVIGPKSGFSFSTLPIGYMGTIGGGREVPIGGTLFANVEADVSANYLVPQYVYKTETNKVNLASSFLCPVNWVGALGSVQLSDFSRSRSTSNGGVGDVIAVPLTVGIHFSENNNLAVSSMIFAPTGQFRPGNLSNLGMGEWTIMPNVAHTYLWKKRGLELDNFVGFDIYGQNLTTRYTSGTMFHWDGMVIQYLSERVGFGAIGSNLTQITRDTGPLADFLHGFEGGAWGAGAMALYVAKVEKPGVVVQLRWVNEFKVTNLLKGNVFMLGLTMKLN
jgi:hypothetical protein